MSPDASHALFVVDDADATARRFRSTRDPLPDGVDARGLAEVACSGSAQFSAAAWSDVRRRLGDPEDLHLVDLRQESHAFLNGAAVSWYARHNWGCVGLDDDEAEALERLRVRLLAESDTVLVGRAEDVKQGRAPALETWPAVDARTEAQIVDLRPGRYVRLRVTDHSKPRDDTVDRFVELVRSVPGRAHFHFHCRGGRGRTTLFMALLDLLRGGAELPLSTIVARHRALSGYDLSATVDPTLPKAPWIAERTGFLSDFHRYARSNPGGLPSSFGEWRRSASATDAAT